MFVRQQHKENKLSNKNGIGVVQSQIGDGDGALHNLSHISAAGAAASSAAAGDAVGAAAHPSWPSRLSRILSRCRTPSRSSSSR